jgi:hypothetical protein
MKTLLALLLLAPGGEIPGKPDTPSAISISTSDADSRSESAANAIAHGGLATSSQNQTQSANAASTATNAGNAQSVNIDQRDRLQAPATHAPAVYASGSCAYGWSAAISVPGGSVGGGRAKPDPACDLREIVRILTPLNPYLALKVACTDPSVKEVAGPSDCVYQATVVATPVPPDLTQYVKRDEVVEILRERDKRIFEKAVAK